jgi:hypothetical protein
LPASKKSVSLEWLVEWTYSAQLIIEITGRSLYASERASGPRDYLPPQRRTSQDGCVAVARNAELGCAVDGGRGRAILAEDVHPDAEALHDVVLALPWLHGHQVVRYGRTGVVPDIPDGADYRYRPVPEWDGRRYKPKVRYETDPDTRVQVSFCPIALDPDDDEVSYSRAAYCGWFEAMTVLLLASAAIEFRAHEVRGLDHLAPAW